MTDEPSVDDYRDLRRWDKWMKWHREMTNTDPNSQWRIDSAGVVWRRDESKCIQFDK